ncbi:hypothetical protein FW774_10260 [Pedobacter sp. BS3]|uniref:hypothetical protein n=1 Tax=Pedobacter sp. BS3 TaxID=2567937 RepID=UPI0011EE95FF|nr:hypothetical protein [Pedobacter sp. BS3]TZF83838.1 hypothetical protein FW774_10260 [Pedobacter sp. BS3]
MKSYLSLFLLLMLVTSCVNTTSDLLRGKKLYILLGNSLDIKKVTYITELELYFKTSKEVEILRTVYYGDIVEDGVDTVKTHAYTFKNNVLDIPDYGLNKLTLIESDKLYNSDKQLFFYKSSILTLSPEEKKARLRETFEHDGWMRLYQMLTKEHINPNYTSLIKAKKIKI